jgi:hypothetical protein
MPKLISSLADIGKDATDFEGNPGAVREVHEDVLRDLMKTNHPIERPRRIALGAEANKPRHRTCV